MWICSATVRRLGWRTLVSGQFTRVRCRRGAGQSRSRTFGGCSGSVYSSLVGEIIAAKVHHLVPYRDEVARELFLGIATCIDFGDRPELRVRAEHQIDASSSPLEFAGRAIASLIAACGAV